MSFFIRPEDRQGVDADETKKKSGKKRNKRTPSSPKGRKQSSWFKWTMKWSLILGIWGLFFVGCFVLWFGYDLPDISKLEQTSRRPSITVLAKDGTKLAVYGDLHGEMVDVEKLPPYVVQALLAIEDHRFYHHFGVDVLGLLRAVWVNYRAGHVVQGGSTITQQLAKNFLQSEKLYGINDRSLRRKAQEALLALWLERKFTKDQILTIYLNRVYLGSGTYGLAAASQHYFGKRPQDLSLYESALIMGLLKAPSKYSPSHNPDLADQRASQVLENMVREGYITEGAKDAALALASMTAETFKGSSIRYFTDWVVDILPTYFDGEEQDLIVVTTLDPKLQSIAQEKLKEVMEEKGKSANVSQMALVSMTKYGAIRALLGGVNYRKSQFNRATQALRQPGSTFKSVVYLAALEAGMHPSDLVLDTPVRIGKWRPKNYKYKSRGEVTLRDALAHSVNTVTVRIAQKLGLSRILDTARRLGFTAHFPDNLSIVLGSSETTLLEMTTAYAVIARQGVGVKPYAILKIQNTKGDILYTHSSNPPQQVVNPGAAYMLKQMLEGVMNYGTGRRSMLDRSSAGKTGTSQKHRDAWFIGFTPELVTGTWSGNDDNVSMKPEAGSPAARLWHLYMMQVPRSQASERVVPVKDTEPSPSGSNLLERLIDSLF